MQVQWENSPTLAKVIAQCVGHPILVLPLGCSGIGGQPDHDIRPRATHVVNGLVTRVEVAAAIARASRMTLITPDETLAALRQFRSEWESFHRLPITENTVVRSDTLAVDHNLRGYDATHLACALTWQDTLGMPVTLASFDCQLIEASRGVQMAHLPF